MALGGRREPQTANGNTIHTYIVSLHCELQHVIILETLQLIRRRQRDCRTTKGA